MTIPAANWCEDCQEVSEGHASVCTMCGGSLTTRPVAPPPTAANNPPSFRAMPSVEEMLVTNMNLETADLLSGLRRQVQETTLLAQQALDRGTQQQQQDEWQAIPLVLLDPGASTDTGKTPTSKIVLDKLPRETLHETSLSLFQVNIEIANEAGLKMWSCDRAVTGGLGALPTLPSKTTKKQSTSTEKSILHVSAPLWIPATRSQRTCQDEWSIMPNNNTPSSRIVVLERGHGISFFDKAWKAQQAGAAGCLIINDKAEPWPYYMKDSRTALEKQKQPITIPVVMLSQADGQDLLARHKNEAENGRTTVTIQPAQSDHQSCIICTDPLALGQTTLTLSQYCGHVFHEACALPWLTQHNTCPTCRRTLPTDDKDQEAERRRQMTSSGGTGGGGRQQNNHGDVFYS